MEQVKEALPDYKNYFEKFTRRSYTLPGEIIFPMHRNSMNQRRGISGKIKDRWDLTLECMRRHYVGEDSPLKSVTDSDAAFYDLFVNFKGYVDQIAFITQKAVDQVLVFKNASEVAQ